MAIAERGGRRGVRETDQPGFVDHPDRLDETLEYPPPAGPAAQRRRLAGTIGRSSSLSDPRQPTYSDPRFDSTTTCLSEPGITNTFHSLAGRDQNHRARGEPAQQRGHREPNDAGQEDPPPAVPVAQRPGEQQQSG